MLKVWTDEISTDESNEDNCYVRLEDNKNGDIELFLCDYKGIRVSDGNILVIDNTFKVLIMRSGFAYDDLLKSTWKGTIITVTDEEIEENILKHKEKELKKKFAEHINEQILTNVLSDIPIETASIN